MNDQEETYKLVEALIIARALTKKYLNIINFNGLNDREIAELREVHYTADRALIDYARTHS